MLEVLVTRLNNVNTFEVLKLALTTSEKKRPLMHVTEDPIPFGKLL